MERPPGSGKGTGKEYDAAGRMTSATGPRGLTSLAWDGAGCLIAATSAGGSETTQAAYAYDQQGRMLAREETAGSTTSASIFLPFALTQETEGRKNTWRKVPRSFSRDDYHDPPAGLYNDCSSVSGGCGWRGPGVASTERRDAETVFRCD